MAAADQAAGRFQLPHCQSVLGHLGLDPAARLRPLIEAPNEKQGKELDEDQGATTAALPPEDGSSSSDDNNDSQQLDGRTSAPVQDSRPAVGRCPCIFSLRHALPRFAILPLESHLAMRCDVLWLDESLIRTGFKVQWLGPLGPQYGVPTTTELATSAKQLVRRVFEIAPHASMIDAWEK